MAPQDTVLLLMATIIVMGYGYSLDMPQALQTQLRQAPYNLTSLEFNFLYFATFIPIMITDIPVGILLDKFPMEKTIIILVLVSFSCQLLSAIIIDLRPTGYLYVLYLCRALIGMAGSSVFTVQGYIFARYGSENFEMLLGFGQCVPFMFDAICSMVTPLIFDASGSVSLPLYVGAGFDFLSLIAAIVAAFIVIRKEKRKKEQRQLNHEQQQEEEQFRIGYLLELPPLFWIVCLNIMFGQLLFGLYANLNDLLFNRFNISYTTAGFLLLIPYTLGSLFALSFGKLLQKRPKSRRSIIMSVSFAFTTGISILYFTSNTTNPQFWTYFFVVLFLISFSSFVGSIYTVLTSTVSNIADKKRLGTAWGVVGTSIGLGQAISSVINGLVEDDGDLSGTYTTLTLVYAFLSIIPIIFAVIFKIGPYTVMDKTFDQVQNKDNEQSQSLKQTLISAHEQIQQQSRIQIKLQKQSL